MTLLVRAPDRARDESPQKLDVAWTGCDYSHSGGRLHNNARRRHFRVIAGTY
ncbi:MAG TPA: hypothetical protein VHG52_00140 [Thermomicrobiales bacterium]|nr:hypothetical protein [Thermomicrobiales bacterium]